MNTFVSCKWETHYIYINIENCLRKKNRQTNDTQKCTFSRFFFGIVDHGNNFVDESLWWEANERRYCPFFEFLSSGHFIWTLKNGNRKRRLCKRAKKNCLLFYCLLVCSMKRIFSLWSDCCFSFYMEKD